jgi:hypothetical protein
MITRHAEPAAGNRSTSDSCSSRAVTLLGANATVTNSLMESYCCPTSVNRGPSWNGKRETVASGPGLLSSAGFLSPPAPRGLEQVGPNRFVVRSVQLYVAYKFNPPTLLRAGTHCVGPFFFCARPGRDRLSGCGRRDHQGRVAASTITSTAITTDSPIHISLMPELLIGLPNSFLISAPSPPRIVWKMISKRICICGRSDCWSPNPTSHCPHHGRRFLGLQPDLTFNRRG